MYDSMTYEIVSIAVFGLESLVQMAWAPHMCLASRFLLDCSDNSRK